MNVLLIDLDAAIRVWEKHPYLIGCSMVVFATSLTILHYCYKNSKDPTSPENEYGIDWVLSIAIRCVVGGMICALYAMLVFFLHSHL